MASTATRAQTWPTLTVAELTAHTPAVDPSPELVESIQERGIDEPLYVATLGDGTYRVVDGTRRLAAAVAAALTEVPVTYRPVIRVDALTRHPGNVRRNLKITREFRASIREHGVRTSIQIRRAADGTLQVVEGHRRLRAAIAEGHTFIPYTYDEVDEAGAYLDMVTTAVHRDGLSDGEQAIALFQAADLGASVKQIAAASGLTQKDSKRLIRLSRSETVKKTAVTLSFSDMERLAELEEMSPELAAEVQAAITAQPDERHDWRIRGALTQAKSRQAAAAHRAKLDADGAQIRTPAELSEKAAPLRDLHNIEYDAHADCKGDVWVLDYPDSGRYSRYCSNTVLYGHTRREDVGKVSTAERKRIIHGNSHWDASTAVRREWLAEYLQRTTHPRAAADIMLSIAATAMLTADGIMQTKQTHPRRDALLGEFLGLPENKRTRAEFAKRAATARRAPAHLFATVAACYELWTVRTVWRTDGTHADATVRTDAARYLGWLKELGYEPTPIETAVMDGTDYDPAANEAAATGQTDTDDTATLDD